MTLLTESPQSPRLPSVGVEDGGDFGRGIAALDPFLYQEERWCEKRGEFQPCVAVFEFAGGRLELCLGCGEERVQRFTRTSGEAA